MAAEADGGSRSTRVGCAEASALEVRAGRVVRIRSCGLASPVATACPGSALRTPDVVGLEYELHG